MKNLNIVFMGTPDFAVGVLDAIYTQKYNIVGVVTAPDRPAGRGQKIRYSAVKEYALEKGLPILQPTDLKCTDFLEELKALQANLQVVVAFRMLPEVVWKMPKYGTFNLHASLLPDYRGAAPINWAIINGETKTGVTTFFIDHKIDTGEIILKKETTILPSENAGSLHDRLMHLGVEAVLETLQLIEKGILKTLPQPADSTKTAFKLNKENCKIDWKCRGVAIYNKIRGLSPYPTAWCIIQDNDKEWSVKIHDSEFIPTTHHLPIGQLITTKKDISIAVKDGFLKILTLQFPGKKAMKSAELLNGHVFSTDAHAL